MLRNIVKWTNTGHFNSFFGEGVARGPQPQGWEVATVPKKIKKIVT